MAVLDGDEVLGVCSRHEIGMRLGARYGFALFSRKPVRNFLSSSPLLVQEDQAITSVLETVSSRSDESFYDDVLLLDANGKFLGLIFVHALVRLQTQFLSDNIGLLEEQKRVIDEKNRQMEEDLAMAREMQLAMLPRGQLCFPAGADASDPLIRFARIYVPTQKVGGDFVHVVQLGDECVGVFIADVMGHGVRAALVTAMLRAFVEETGSRGTEPGQLLTQLNRDLTAILREAGDLTFATAFYLIVDSRAGMLRYACAGHPCPARLNRRLGTVEMLHCPRTIAGPGLCVFPNAVYGTSQSSIEDDDVILLYTDGVTEASNSDDELFGIERLQQALQKHAMLEVTALAEAVYSEVEHFAADAPFADDICLAALNVSLCDSPHGLVKVGQQHE